MNSYRLLRLMVSLMLTVLLLSVSDASAATPIPTAGRIEGRVFRSDTDKPIAGAAVKLRDATLDKDVAEATTDAQGRYSFAEVKPGTYSLGVTWKFKDKADAPCTGLAWTRDNWLATVGVKEDGDLVLVATGAGKEHEFSVVAGKVLQKDVDLKCK